jgi:CheY-like chemotaxis protein
LNCCKAITAYCLKDDRQKYLKMGFDDYIPKPVNINELKDCFVKYIENK